MLDIRHILVPIDLRVHTPALADVALAMANRLGAERTTFLHVLPHLPDLSDYLPDTLARLDEGFRAHAEEKMTAFLDSVRDRAAHIDGVVVDGETAEAILARARADKVDLIVIATHGTKGIEKVLLGSVADRVIKGAPCPTLVFNPFGDTRGYEVCKPLSSCIETV
ncbi:universal stress protein [Desulfobulbus elongatus]|uniref:universal stress protein n=1 Tax=Desulfobulbus elongatus TaxID=53332 RepID=UPI000685FE31|nr:universal stress protein [Desulfobulbus elongatus]